MKSQKLFVMIVIICLLVGASGAAMARNDCPEGFISGGEFNEIIIDEFVSCSIVGVIVKERVLIRDAENFNMLSSLVEGNLQVINVKNAAIVETTVNGGNLVTRGNGDSSVVRNIVLGGNIRVNDDTCEQQQIATVVQNLVFVGNLRVNCNETADVKENKVTDGNITCRDNDRLDSKDNDAFGGKVNCSRSLFN